LITTPDEAGDVQPARLVTAKVYVPEGIPVTVVLTPVPEVVTAPGVRVIVQIPDDGKPLSITLPVATPQVGWVIVPTAGAEGITGCVFITILPDEMEVQPTELVTVYVYVPEASPDKVVPAPVPVVVTDPGVRVRVHVPVKGRPLSATLPVASAHVG
jgi:hypothetical protein